MLHLFDRWFFVMMACLVIVLSLALPLLLASAG